MKTSSKILAFIALTVMSIVASCSKPEFTIDFKFPDDFVGNYMINYYAWDSQKGTWIENVASIQSGTAHVDCATKRPTLVYIRDASTSTKSITVYAEHGDKIVITGENNDMNTWKVKGNKMTERWSDWRNRNADILSRSRDKFTPEKEKIISNYVNDNKSDRLSTLILLTEWDRRSNPEGFLKLWNSIDEGAREQQLIEMCGAPDLLGVEFIVDAKGNLAAAKSKNIKELTIRTFDNGLDTLRFGKAKSTIMYFHYDNNADRERAIDSLRSVAKEYPDTTKRIIATVSMQPDSVLWRNMSRRDTIRGGLRCWVPIGLADPSMVKAGVTRIPWFVVIGKDGNRAYSGDDPDEAISAFRKGMGKK